MTGGPHYAANLAHLVNAPHAVYIVWNETQAIYVGMTSDWQSRVAQHRHYLNSGRATHIDVWHVAPDRWTAEQLEEDIIRTLDPLDNGQHSPRREADRAEWAEFSACIDAGGCSTACHPEQWALYGYAQVSA